MLPFCKDVLFSISQCIRRHVVHIRTCAFLLLSTVSVFNFPSLHEPLETVLPVGQAVGICFGIHPASPSRGHVCLAASWTTKLLPNHCSFVEWPICMLQPYSIQAQTYSTRQTSRDINRSLPEQAFGVEHLLTFKHPLQRRYPSTWTTHFIKDKKEKPILEKD